MFITTDRSLSIDQDHLDDILDDTDAILVPLMACGQLLTHSSAVVRVASLDFLVSSVSTTKPFPPQVLSLVLENLAPFHADTDSRVRNEVLDIIRSIVQRLRGATSRLDRDLSISRSRPEHKKFYLGDKTAQFSNTMLNSEQLMDQHIAFLTSYIRFLGLELLPTASYQRHITALKALAILLQSGLDSTVPPAYLSKLTRGDVKWPFNLNIKQPLLHRMLIDLSMDPFDDVRNAAVLLLKMTASTLGQLQSVWMANSLRQSSTLRFQTSSAKQKDSEAHHQNQHECAVSGFVAIMSRAQKIMHSTGRADHADGVARLYEVLDEVCNAGTTTVQKSSGTVGVWWSSRLSIVDHILSDLEQGLLIAKDNLRLAVAGFPIHGHIAALRSGNFSTL